MTNIDAPAIERFELSGPQPPSGDGTIAVLLHGRGSDEHDLQGLRRLLPASWTLVTPRAIHPGAPWGYGPGWAWYRYVAQDRVVPETLEQSLSALDAFLDALPEHLDGPVRRLVLGGFSQGGTSSLAYALTRPGRVAAVLNFSGFLADGIALPEPEEVPPIFWGHGLHDEAIPHVLAVRGRGRLREAGIDPVVSDHPIGHGIVPEEVAAAVEVATEPSR
jgi:phospholipase/carboxylesterase